MEYLIAMGAAAVIVGGVFAIYQLFQLVKVDSTCRGMKHPKFWGTLAISGNNQSGLILYLIARRKHPIISMTGEQKAFIESCKKKTGIGFVFLVVGAIACVWGMVLTFG